MNWKNSLDEATTFEGAEAVIDSAIATGTKEDLLEFLGALFVEYIGPDGAGGGEVGTLLRMRRLYDFLAPNACELSGTGIELRSIEAYFHHGEVVA